MNILLWMKRTTDKQHQEQYNQQKPHRKLFWKENKSESVYFKKDINIIYIHKEEQTSRRLRFSQFSIAFGDFQSEAKWRMKELKMVTTMAKSSNQNQNI